MTRHHMNCEEQEAMQILDFVAAGFDVPISVICWALTVTGDLIGLPRIWD